MSVSFFYGPFSFPWVQAILSCEQCLQAAGDVELCRALQDWSRCCLRWARLQHFLWYKLERSTGRAGSSDAEVLFGCNSAVTDYPWADDLMSVPDHPVQSGWPLGVLLGPPLGRVFWIGDFSSWGEAEGGAGKFVVNDWLRLRLGPCFRQLWW